MAYTVRGRIRSVSFRNQFRYDPSRIESIRIRDAPYRIDYETIRLVSIAGIPKRAVSYLNAPRGSHPHTASILQDCSGSQKLEVFWKMSPRGAVDLRWTSPAGG